MIHITDDEFKFKAEANGEKADINFHWRDPVDAASITFSSHVWKYGNPTNSVFIRISKKIPHLFDRIQHAKPTKAFKLSMEKDWERMELSEEEDESWDPEEDEDPNLIALTDDNFEKKLSKASVMAFQISYPWCEHCKNDNRLKDAAKQKSRNKTIKYAKVDARESRLLRNRFNPQCVAGMNCMENIYVASKTWGEPYRYNHSDNSIAGITKFLTRMGEECPKVIKDSRGVDDLESLDEVTVLGVFHSKKDKEKMEAYKAMALENRLGRFYFGMATEKDLAEGEESLTNFTQSVCRANGVRTKVDPTKGTARMVVIKRFAPKESRDGVAIFGHRVNDTFDGETMMKFIKKFSLRLLPHENPGGHADRARVARDKGFAATAHIWVKSGSQREEAPGVVSVIRQAAQQYHRDILFEIHDETKETGKLPIKRNVSQSTADMLLDWGLDGGDRPLFGLQRSVRDPKTGSNLFSDTLKYAFPDLSKYTTRKDISDFIQAVIAGNVSEASRSEPLSSEKIVRGVHKVVGNSLPALEQDPQPHFIVFHSRVGEQQQQLLGQLELLNDALKAGGATVKVGHMNCKYNRIPHWENLVKLNELVWSNPQSTTPPEKLVFMTKGQLVPLETTNTSATKLIEFLHSQLIKVEKTLDVEAALAFVRHQEQLNFCKVHVFQHGDLTGWGATFPRGSHNTSTLLAGGARNDDISAAIVSENCKATLYQDGDMSGWRVVLTQGTYTWNDLQLKGAKNDEVSSMHVEVYHATDENQDATKCRVGVSGGEGQSAWEARFPPGAYAEESYHSRGALNDEGTMISVPENCTATVFENSDYTGWSKEYYSAPNQTLQLGASALRVSELLPVEPDAAPDTNAAEAPAEAAPAETESESAEAAPEGAAPESAEPAPEGAAPESAEAADGSAKSEL